jgi:phospholysine phosphohistidine inorganic pyrophosphate phosphatase
MQALLLDLDGVFYVGSERVPGADTTIGWLAESRKPHLFLTNTTSRPRKALVQKLLGLGIAVSDAEILTPPVAAVAWLRQRGVHRLAAYVPGATLEEFQEFDLIEQSSDQPAEAVVVGDLGDGWDFATLNHAFNQLMQEPQPHLVALGMTRFWRAPDGLRLDTAPFVMALSHASGAIPVVLGKPARQFFHAALNILGVVPDQTVMVGDDIDADVGGAQQAGLSGVLVRTGKYRSDQTDEIHPDAVLDSIAELPSWWSSQTK